MSHSSLDSKIVELYHISRTALAAKTKVPDKHERMMYVAHTLKIYYPELIEHFKFSKHAWFHITDVLRQE